MERFPIRPFKTWNVERGGPGYVGRSGTFKNCGPKRTTAPPRCEETFPGIPGVPGIGEKKKIEKKEKKRANFNKIESKSLKF